ncbi:MAG: hypothetical protein SPL61_10745 [Saccharofermentans sp.]|nr:hypothetical protein [Saccharofermentans sp.]
MNNRIISIVLAGCVALTGCSSVKETEPNETLIETTTPITASEVVDIEEPIITTEPEKLGNVYPLDDMTAEEIVGECKKIWEAIPKSHGITVDEYQAILGHQQSTNQPNSFPNYMFDNGLNDYVLSVEVKGVREQEDGTIYCSGDAEVIIWIWMTINIHIEDQNKAEQVYDLMMKEVFRATKDDRDGDSWEATAENPQAPFVCATLCKDDSGYNLKFTKIYI